MNIFNLYILFWIYSFLGWCVETIWVSFRKHKLINRGFFLGPYCPIYGTGGILLLSLSNYQNDPLVVFILSIFICSVVEYLTSYFLELIYRVRWWDYTNRFFNINGRICLFNSIFFGLFGLFAVCLLNPFLTSLIINLKSNIKLIGLVIIFIVTSIDMIITFNAMFDFRKYVNSLKDSKIKRLFKPNYDATEEMRQKVKSIFKEKSFIHKHLLKAYSGFKVYKNSFLRKSEELIRYKRIKNIENTFIIGSFISIIIGLLLGLIFKKVSLFIIISFVINIVIVRFINRGKNEK